MNEKWHIPSILRMQGIIWDNLTAPIRHVEVNQWRGGYTYWHLPYARGSSSQWLNLYVPASVEPVPLLVLVHGGGNGYRFNQDGNQVSYRCDVRRVTTINFDRNGPSTAMHRGECFVFTGKTGNHVATGVATREMATDSDARLWITLDGSAIWED